MNNTQTNPAPISPKQPRKRIIELNVTDDQLHLLVQSVLKNYTYLNQYNETKEEVSDLRDILKQLNDQR